MFYFNFYGSSIYVYSCMYMPWVIYPYHQCLQCRNAYVTMHCCINLSFFFHYGCNKTFGYTNWMAFIHNVSARILFYLWFFLNAYITEQMVIILCFGFFFLCHWNWYPYLAKRLFYATLFHYCAYIIYNKIEKCIMDILIVTCTLQHNSTIGLINENY